MLALRAHGGCGGYRQQACAAQDRIREVERRAAVARMGAGLIRAALIAALGREGDDS